MRKLAMPNLNAMLMSLGLPICLVAVWAAIATAQTATATMKGVVADGGGNVAAGAFGYARLGEQIVQVKTVEFDPIAARRRFRVGLENGRVIEGEAVTLRTISTPIEGRRRPSTTVMVKSDIGPMVGNLNDWEPDQQ